MKPKHLPVPRFYRCLLLKLRLIFTRLYTHKHGGKEAQEKIQEQKPEQPKQRPTVTNASGSKNSSENTKISDHLARSVEIKGATPEQEKIQFLPIMTSENVCGIGNQTRLYVPETG